MNRENHENEEKQTSTNLMFFKAHMNYPVIDRVVKNEFKFTTHFNENLESDVIWHDVSIDPLIFNRMQSFQRCNHFPGMFNLAKKNQLGLNLEKIRKAAKKDYHFHPKTWLLPSDINELK